MKKLNLGCGSKYSSSWVNVDFHSEDSSVISCNLLKPLPFEGALFDVVYSSHLFEHFTREDAQKVMHECFRILKPGGVLRVVVPDLEYTCREYLRVLDAIENQGSNQHYEWIVIELLDQMVRTRPGGHMAEYLSRIQNYQSSDTMSYVESRVGQHIWQQVPTSKNLSIAQKILRASSSQIKNKMFYAYVGAVKQLIPKALRSAMIDDTPLGEKHKWMYDRYSLKVLFEKVGFVNVSSLDAHTSSIVDFDSDGLDTNPNGTPYKPGSLYFEGVRPDFSAA